MNAAPESDIRAPSDLSALLARTRRAAPVLDRTITEFGSATVAEYVGGLKPAPAPSYQSRDDLLEVVHGLAESLLSTDVATRLCRQLDANPVVLTANHHGVDYFAQSVQGSLLFSMREVRGEPVSTVPIFACSAVPLDNITYPLGMLFYGLSRRTEPMPMRFPVFSNRNRRALVHAAPGLDKSLCDRALGRLEKLSSEGEVELAAVDAAKTIIRDVYAAPDVLGLDRYAAQSVRINAEIWKRLFASDVVVPDLAYLEFEAIARELVMRDLGNPQSLIFRLLLSESVRDYVVTTLDGQRACWKLDELGARLDGDFKGSGGGTVFFWGISAKGRRVPLTVSEHGGRSVLEGFDTQGEHWGIELTADAIYDALASGRLLPSLFTAFSAIGIARGVMCLGAYFQAEYLPMMQQTICRALARGRTPTGRIDALQVVPTGGYLGGMQTVMHPFSDGSNGWTPAGPLEIIAAGGLGADDLATMRALSVRDAHLASMSETAVDVAILPAGTNQDWRGALALELHTALPPNVVAR
ncbi:MAG: hypothetical protein K0U93_02525 [Gammaproteobacteria bacterium]|nr:hypothetical protein [Gammaproteobacteria bacterium]